MSPAGRGTSTETGLRVSVQRERLAGADGELLLRGREAGLLDGDLVLAGRDVVDTTGTLRVRADLRPVEADGAREIGAHLASDAAAPLPLSLATQPAASEREAPLGSRASSRCSRRWSPRPRRAVTSSNLSVTEVAARPLDVPEDELRGAQALSRLGHAGGRLVGAGEHQLHLDQVLALQKREPLPAATRWLSASVMSLATASGVPLEGLQAEDDGGRASSRKPAAGAKTAEASRGNQQAEPGKTHSGRHFFRRRQPAVNRRGPRRVRASVNGMRLGVSGKIFLAYTVLLLAFAANATFTLV